MTVEAIRCIHRNTFRIRIWIKDSGESSFSEITNIVARGFCDLVSEYGSLRVIASILMQRHEILNAIEITGSKENGVKVQR